MTIPKDVQDALSRVQLLCDAEADWADIDIVDWQIIRTHLLSQDAEIARLESQRESVERDCRDYRQIQIEDSARAELAESRLAAANAQLRLMHRVPACAVTVACADDGGAKDHELSKLESVLRDQGWITTATVPATPVDDYLQGAGDEA